MRKCLSSYLRPTTKLTWIYLRVFFFTAYSSSFTTSNSSKFLSISRKIRSPLSMITVTLPQYSPCSFPNTIRQLKTTWDCLMASLSIKSLPPCLICTEPMILDPAPRIIAALQQRLKFQELVHQVFYSSLYNLVILLGRLKRWLNIYPNFQLKIYNIRYIAPSPGGWD